VKVGIVGDTGCSQELYAVLAPIELDLAEPVGQFALLLCIEEPQQLI
jgi:hypothetical protein